MITLLILSLGLVLISKTENIIVFVVSVLVSAAAIVIILAPIQGFYEPECVSEVELLVLQEETEGTYYLNDDDESYIYAYDNSEKYGLEGEAYHEAHIDKLYYNIIIYQSSDCTKPVLKKFVKKAKRGIFCFAPFSDEEEYVFYLPENSVLE